MSLKFLAIALVYFVSICHNLEGRNMETTNTIVGLSVTKDCTATDNKMIITLTLASAVTGEQLLKLNDGTSDVVTATCKVSPTVATQLICTTGVISSAAVITFTKATLGGIEIAIADSITKSFYYSGTNNQADLIQTTPQLIDYSESKKNFFTIKFKTSMTNQDIKIYAQKEAQKITLSKECSVDSTDSKILNCRSTSKATLPKGDYKITHSICPSVPPATPMTSIIDLKVIDDNIVYDDEDEDGNNSGFLCFSYHISFALIYLLI